MDMEGLRAQIQHNCDISDSRYAGLFSLCGLLLRMRDFYKWERGIPPWEEPEPSEVLGWVDERESYWQDVSHLEFQPIVIGDESFEPFDMAAVNERLRPQGLVYGAGYVLGMKPSFFFAEVAETRRMDGLTVDLVDHELARDIYISPAMRQGNQIFARRSAMLFYLWDLIQEMRPSVRAALTFGLAEYRLDAEKLRQAPKALGSQLYRVVRQEMDTWVYHEVGEALEDTFNGDLWHEMVARYCNTPVEIFARVIKDMLADTHSGGLLGHIVEHRQRSSLAFYVAFMRPFSRAVYPEILEAFRRFLTDQDWAAIETARHAGQLKAQDLARRLTEIHERGRSHTTEWSQEQIVTTLIEPLGISGANRTHEAEEVD
jgi:hypothetical protein